MLLNAEVFSMPHYFKVQQAHLLFFLDLCYFHFFLYLSQPPDNSFFNP